MNKKVNPGPSRKNFWLIILAAGISAFSIYWLLGGEEETGPAYIPFEVKRGDIRIEILATGGVEPQNRIEIKPPFAGRIEEVLVREGQDVKRGDILIWMSSSDRAALLDTARMKGTNELKKWESLMKATPLLAPLSGKIIARNFEPGQTVGPNDRLLVLSDRLIVKASVDETDLAKIRLWQKVDIQLDAYPDKRFPAAVSHIAFEASTANNVTVYEVDVRPKNVPSFMRSGMTADVYFLVREKNNVLLVPSGSLIRRQKMTMVRLPAGPDGEENYREVQIGMDDGKYYEVRKGVEAGEIVLESGLPFSRPDRKGSPFSFGRKKSEKKGGGKKRK